MTWLGKILTFVVLIAAVVWAYFSVQAYVARVNWKADREQYKTAYEKVVADRAVELQRYQSAEESTRRLLAKEQKANEDLRVQVADLGVAVNKAATDFRALQANYDKADVATRQLQANLDNIAKELDTVRARNTSLENTQLALVLETERAKREELRSKIEARRALALADEYAKKNEDLTNMVAQLKAGGGRIPLGGLEKGPPALLSGLRGTVENVSGNLVEINIGSDAGLGVGNVLDVYRYDGGGAYLGSIKITDPLALYPKKAVGVFTPKRGNVPVDRLRPEELPKAGDLVGPPASGFSAR